MANRRIRRYRERRTLKNLGGFGWKNLLYATAGAFLGVGAITVVNKQATGTWANGFGTNPTGGYYITYGQIALIIVLIVLLILTSRWHWARMVFGVALAVVLAEIIFAAIQGNWGNGNGTTETP